MCVLILQCKDRLKGRYTVWGGEGGARVTWGVALGGVRPR